MLTRNQLESIIKEAGYGLEKQALSGKAITGAIRAMIGKGQYQRAVNTASRLDGRYFGQNQVIRSMINRGAVLPSESRRLSSVKFKQKYSPETPLPLGASELTDKQIGALKRVYDSSIRKEVDNRRLMGELRYRFGVEPDRPSQGITALHRFRNITQDKVRNHVNRVNARELESFLKSLNI